MNNAYDPLNPRRATSWERFKRYLSTRPMECWGFFIAGLFIGSAVL